MKPLTLKPDEIKSLQSGRVVIWLEMKEQPKGELCPCIGDGEWHDKGSGLTVFEPYQPGAELWVRETWASASINDSLSPREIYTSACDIWYQSDGDEAKTRHLHRRGRWRPSIHMPRWASRYTVRIVSVEPEQRETWGWRVELEVV